MSEHARGNRFGPPAVWYVLGAVAGGAVLGGFCAAASLSVRFGPAVAFAIAAGVAVVAVASDLRLFGRSLPEHPRQVDERWLVKYRRGIYASGYGAQIGTGFATYIMTAAVYLTAALAVLTGSPTDAFVVGLVFGAVRGLSIVVAAFATTPQRLRAAHFWLPRLDGVSLQVCVLVSAVVAVVAGARAGGVVTAAALALAVAGAAGSRRLPRRAPTAGTAR